MIPSRILLILVLIPQLALSLTHNDALKYISSDSRFKSVDAIKYFYSAEYQGPYSLIERINLIEDKYFTSSDYMAKGASLNGLMIFYKDGSYEINLSSEKGFLFLTAIKEGMSHRRDDLAIPSFNAYKELKDVDDTEIISIIRTSKSVVFKNNLIGRLHHERVATVEFIDVLIEELHDEFPSSAFESASVLMSMSPPPNKALPYLIDMITKNKNYFANMRLVNMLKVYEGNLLPYITELKAMEKEEGRVYRRHHTERLRNIESLISYIEEL